MPHTVTLFNLLSDTDLSHFFVCHGRATPQLELWIGANIDDWTGHLRQGLAKVVANENLHHPL